MAPAFQFFQDLGLALLMGGLIGLERERNHGEKTDHEFGGLRTMSLVAVYGFLSSRLFFDEIFVFIAMASAYFALVVASYVMSSSQNKNSGATTEIAGLFAFLIGVLVGQNGDMTLYATVITLLVVILLYFKTALHKFAHHIDNEELYDTLKFIAVVFVVLPLLPNEFYGPLQVFNPYEIWFVVVLLCSISFASYIGIKLLGPKNGIGIGGFLGGLISSTAVAMSFSALSKKSQKIVNPFVFGILIAASAMFIRVFFTVSIINKTLLDQLTVPLLTMGWVGFLLSAYFWFKKHEHPDSAPLSSKDFDLKSPFQLSTALKFALIFAALLYASKYASVTFGDNGLYLTAFLSGTFDVDAITVSMAHLTMEGTVSTHVGALGVLIAAMTNTLSKACFVLFFASRAVGLRVMLSMLLIVASGFLTFFIPVYGAFAF